MLGYIEDLPIESLLDLAPMTQIQHLELSVRVKCHAEPIIIGTVTYTQKAAVPP